MLDQSFSADNFRKIIDIENRKGIYLEGDFFPSIVLITEGIKRCNLELKALYRLSLSKENFEIEKNKINQKKEKLKEQKEVLYKENLNIISSNITSKKYKIEINKNTAFSNKAVYETVYTPENVFALKQLQYNIRKLYKVKQSNRYAIVSQLKNILGDAFPKIIVRTDIKEFYESIPQDKLIKQINDENLLTHLSRKFIYEIFIEYNRHTHNTIGVPRGVGISAYLVELFMRKIDNSIKALPGIIYYARYVDDMIIVFMPSLSTIKRDYKKEIVDEIQKQGLTVNDSKTFGFDLSDKSINTQYEFEYLGYRYLIGYQNKKPLPIKVSLTQKKKKRYAKKIITAFNLYENESKLNAKKARKIFIKRIRFLLGNTRLLNNKKNICKLPCYSASY